MDDRSERLRQRRKRSSAGANRDEPQAADEESTAAETSESDEPSKPSKPTTDAAAADRDDGETAAEETGDGDRTRPVKEQQVGTYMYLPESQVKRLNRQYNVLKAEYEFEYSEEFEKNRHFYPLVVQYGLERLDELDTEQVRARLQQMYE